MRKKISSILIVALFTFTSFTTLPTLGIKTDNVTSIFEVTSSEDGNIVTEYWALLVAPFDPIDHKDGFMHIAKLFKNVLLSSGWKENNIITLLDKEPSISNFSNAVDFIAGNIKPSDTLVVYLSSHGTSGYFCLYKQAISYKKIDNELDKINCAAMGVMTSACESGGAIPYLKQDGRVIVTACRAEENTPGIAWMFSLGSDGFGDYCVNGGNNDGAVSIEEAFNYVKGDTDESNWSNPQIQDDYPGELYFAPLNWLNGKVDQMSLNATNPSSHNGHSWIEQDNHAAQSFIPSFDILTKIKLRMTYFNFNELSSLSFSIRNELSGDDITAITLNASEIDPISLNDQFFYLKPLFNGYVTIDFPDISVIPGEKYYIVCNTSAEIQEVWDINWHGQKNDAYENGECYESLDNGESWTLSSQCADLIFITYGKNETGNSPPYIPKRPCGTTKGEINKNHSYCVSTTDVDDDMIYYKFDWGDGTFSNWLGPYPSGEIVCLNHTFSHEDIYYIKAKAKDEHGVENDWSSVLKVNTYPNNPPSKPIKPFIGKNSGLYSYFTKTSDPDGDVIFYNFSWDDGYYSGWIGAGDSNEEIAFEIKRDWIWNDSYNIRVKAKDRYGAESDWSEPYLFMDKESPTISIIEPQNALYIGNRFIRRFLIRKPLIIGKDSIKIYYKLSDNVSGLKMYEFYIDNKLIENYTFPYAPCKSAQNQFFMSYSWYKDNFYLLRHRHVIKIIVYDNAGNKAVEKLPVWRFL